MVEDSDVIQTTNLKKNQTNKKLGLKFSEVLSGTQFH